MPELRRTRKRARKEPGAGIVALQKLTKLATVLREPAYRRALRHGVAAAVEHDAVTFAHRYRSVVDVGAGRGQFALVARRRFPEATLHCFEPLDEAREKLVAVTRSLPRVHVFATALGSENRTGELRVSHNPDASSLLPMTPLHAAAFPGTGETGDDRAVPVARLENAVAAEDLAPPRLLKIDTQGTELDVLRGAEQLLPLFTTVLVECSFAELYAGQALAGEVICFLHERGLRLRGVHSLSADTTGHCLQADFLFEREPPG